MKHIFPISTLLLLSLLALTHKPEPQTITVFDGLPQPALMALQHEGVRLEDKGSHLRLIVTDKEQALCAFARARRSLGTGRDIAQANVQNAFVTRTVEGTPYRRQYVVYAEDGSVESIEEDPSDWRWVYSPDHPDAVRDDNDPHRGYYAMPNVNLEQEQQDWFHLAQDVRDVEAVAHCIDDKFIFARPKSPAQNS